MRNRPVLFRRLPARMGEVPALESDAGDPALIKADFLIGQSYDVKVTNLRKPPFNALTAKNQDLGILPDGPIVSNEVPFRLVAGEPRLIAAGNVKRKGMMLQNLDAVDNLFYSFGPQATATSAFLTPGATLLLDFICPVNSVWCFATVNLSGYYRDFTNSQGRK